MLNFQELAKGLEKGKEASIKPGPLLPKGNSTTEINFNQLVGIEIVKPIVKLSKEEIERRRTTEPGYKIPTANFQQVVQWCETCEDVTPQAHNVEKQKFRCLICKNDRSYAR